MPSSKKLDDLLEDDNDVDGNNKPSLFGSLHRSLVEDENENPFVTIQNDPILFKKLVLIMALQRQPKDSKDGEGADTASVEVDDDEEETSKVRWIQHYDDESGFYYYENIVDGTVTWDVPNSQDEFIPAVEEG